MNAFYDERRFYLLLARESYKTARKLESRGEPYKANAYRIRAANALHWSRKCKAAGERS